MKKAITGIALFLCGVFGFGQTVTTPNIQLQIPAFHSNNWNLPLNYNFTQIDSFLSGKSPIPGLSVTGNISVTGNLTANSFKLTSFQNAQCLSTDMSGNLINGCSFASGVLSFNTRTGSIILTAADVNALGLLTNSISGNATTATTATHANNLPSDFASQSAATPDSGTFTTVAAGTKIWANMPSTSSFSAPLMVGTPSGCTLVSNSDFSYAWVGPCVDNPGHNAHPVAVNTQFFTSQGLVTVTGGTGTGLVLDISTDMTGHVQAAWLSPLNPAPGSGYTNGDVVTLVQTGGAGAQVRLTVAAGVVTGATLVAQGTGYGLLASQGGSAVAAYDGRMNLGTGTSANFYHAVDFQSATSYDTKGTTQNGYGFVSVPRLTNGTVVNRLSGKVQDFVTTAKATGWTINALLVGPPITTANTIRIYTQDAPQSLVSGDKAYIWGLSGAIGSKAVGSTLTVNSSNLTTTYFEAPLTLNTATITNTAISAGTATFTLSGTCPFSASQTVDFSGLTAGRAVNFSVSGQVYVVTACSGTTLAVTALAGQTAIPGTIASTADSGAVNQDSGVQYDSGTALYVPQITAFQVTSNVIYLTAANTLSFNQGISISGLAVGTYLNGLTGCTVQALGTTSSIIAVSCAGFSHADVGLTSDTGLAQPSPAVTLNAGYECDKMWYGAQNWCIYNTGPTPNYFGGPAVLNSLAPAAWPSVYGVLQVGDATGIFGSGQSIYLGSNTITTTTTPFHKYIQTGPASQIDMFGGVTTFRYAASGSAGANQTQTINATLNGDGVGTLEMVTGGIKTDAGDITVDNSHKFNGPGTGLTGTAAGLSIGGNAATATTLAGGSIVPAGLAFFPSTTLLTASTYYIGMGFAKVGASMLEWKAPRACTITNVQATFYVSGTVDSGSDSTTVELYDVTTATALTDTAMTFNLHNSINRGTATGADSIAAGDLIVGYMPSTSFTSNPSGVIGTMEWSCQ